MTIGELWRRAGIDPAAVIQATERLAELVKPAAVWVAETVARVAPVVARVAEAVTTRAATSERTILEMTGVSDIRGNLSDERGKSRDPRAAHGTMAPRICPRPTMP